MDRAAVSWAADAPVFPDTDDGSRSKLVLGDRSFLATLRE
jgi:hypothetical protein